MSSAMKKNLHTPSVRFRSTLDALAGHPDGSSTVIDSELLPAPHLVQDSRPPKGMNRRGLPFIAR